MTMEKITIEKANDNLISNLFIVRQGDKYTEVYFEEALATVCALMMQDSDAMPQRFLGWMMTEEQRNNLSDAIRESAREWNEGEEE